MVLISFSYLFFVPVNSQYEYLFLCYFTVCLKLWPLLQLAQYLETNYRIAQKFCGPSFIYGFRRECFHGFCRLRAHTSRTTTSSTKCFLSLIHKRFVPQRFGALLKSVIVQIPMITTCTCSDLECILKLSSWGVHLFKDMLVVGTTDQTVLQY